ncbi:MAG: hypothetical protein DRG80_06170 [Deltaproteobacteria bacterium]|nr:MAG: hypothetical protein DRG80_06170 [Deltaproteobacteria bacterium]
MTISDTYGYLILNSQNGVANSLDSHQNAPYTHPAKTEQPKPLKISAAYLDMVPKAGLEPARA